MDELRVHININDESKLLLYFEYFMRLVRLAVILYCYCCCCCSCSCFIIVLLLFSLHVVDWRNCGVCRFNGDACFDLLRLKCDSLRCANDKGKVSFRIIAVIHTIPHCLLFLLLHLSVVSFFSRCCCCCYCNAVACFHIILYGCCIWF